MLDATLPKLPEPGTIVDQKYEIVGVIGRGGMGVVFEAVHLKIRQRVALKMLHPFLKDEPGVLERFEREARAAGQLRSPFIARILDVETSAAVPYIVMEFLEGRDLEEELVVKKTLPITEAVDYALQACSAVSHAHALGIIHRDLKPANLYLCTTAEGPTIKLLDFGISKITAENDGRLTAAMTTLGSPIYMSPEQLRGAAEVDHRADIWGLGVILYELLAGRPPYSGTVTSVTASIIADAAPRLVTYRPDVPLELETAITNALQKSPEHRYANARELADALVPFASADVVKRVRATLSLPPPAPSSRRSVKAPDGARAEDVVTVYSQRAPPSSSETRHSFAAFEDSVRPSHRTRVMIALASVVAVIALAITGLTQVTKKAAPAVIASGAAPPSLEPPTETSATSTSVTSASASANEPVVAATKPSAARPTAPPRIAPRPPPPSPPPTRGDPKNPIHL